MCACERECACLCVLAHTRVYLCLHVCLCVRERERACLCVLAHTGVCLAYMYIKNLDEKEPNTTPALPLQSFRPRDSAKTMNQTFPAAILQLENKVIEFKLCASRAVEVLQKFWSTIVLPAQS